MNTTIGKSLAYYRIFVVSLAGNSFIGIVVYKPQTLRKPMNYFIVTMAMSDLLYTIFLILLDLTEFFVESWQIGGSLGQALCKPLPFLADISIIVSIRRLVLKAVDRFEVVVFPLLSLLITSNVPLIHSRHVDRSNRCLVSVFIHLQTC